MPCSRIDTLQDRVLAAQDAALDRLVTKDFGGTLLSLRRPGRSAAPRIAPPRVTFDFWDQLAAYERLEELRMFRPGIYKGLPRVDSGRRQGQFRGQRHSS